MEKNIEKSLKKRQIVKNLAIFLIGSSVAGTVGYFAYQYLKRSPEAIIAAKILATGDFVRQVPEFIKVPDFMYLRITDPAEVKKSTGQTLEFLKILQYDSSFKDRRNLEKSTVLLSSIYDRMWDLIALQNSPEFDPRSMRSLERITFMLCRKSLSHKKICANLETKQVIKGLMLAIDKYDSNH